MQQRERIQPPAAPRVQADEVRREWGEAAEYAIARASQCEALPPQWWLESARGDPEELFDTRVSARSIGEDLVLEEDIQGGGVDGESTNHLVRVALPSCATVEIHTRYSDGFYDEEVEVEPSTTPAEHVAQTLGATLFDAAAPSQGATRLYASVVDRLATADDELTQFDGPAVSPPLTVPQDWISGRPVAAPQVYDPSRRRRFFSVDPPTRGPETGLWAAPLRGRNGGFALAQYDHSRDRHRWLFWSRFTVNATRVSWGPHTDDLRLAFGWSQHDLYRWERGREGFFVLDLRDGTAHRLTLPIEPQVPEAYEMANGPEEALSALGAAWTRDGVRYRRPDGSHETVRLHEIRSWLDAETGGSWSGPPSPRETRGQ